MKIIIHNDQGSSNFLRALIFVDELARSGMKEVCISPGSRSTPLALAFFHHGQFNLHIIVDERSAAYFGLGIAKGSKMPVALVCTSGTATANYFPAIIEADKNNIPLLIITADRPSKLRNTGVNQTIDQVELYGNKVRFFKDIIEPKLRDNTNSKIREYTEYIRNAACEAVNYSLNKFQSGPVHINFPFTKPLEPETQDLVNDLIKLMNEDQLFKGKNDNIPYLVISDPGLKSNISEFKELLNSILQSKRIIIICGPLENDCELADNVLKLNQYLKAPIIADVLSCIRFPSNQDTNIITGINQLISSNVINGIQEPDLILQFGRNPISSALEKYVNELINCPKIHITQSTNWTDPIRLLDQKIHASPDECIEFIISNIDNISQDQAWIKSLIMLNEKVIQIVDKNIENGLEVNLISQIIEGIDQEMNIFLSNSLSIRYFDEFVYNSKIKLHIYGNRGASGIDGIISTAAGVAYSTKRQTLLIIGDLALFHDMQGLLHLQKAQVKLSILTINNSGGGIFQRLPISKYKSLYKPLFNTAIGVDIRKIADVFEIGYQLINVLEDGIREINYNLIKPENKIFEYKTDSFKFENFRKNLHVQIKEII